MSTNLEDSEQNGTSNKRQNTNHDHVNYTNKIESSHANQIHNQIEEDALSDSDRSNGPTAADTTVQTNSGN